MLLKMNLKQNYQLRREQMVTINCSLTWTNFAQHSCFTVSQFKLFFFFFCLSPLDLMTDVLWTQAKPSHLTF